MLTPLDWLRLCRSGTEVVATLKLLEQQPDVFLQETIGQPFSALHTPCERCGIFTRQEKGSKQGTAAPPSGEEAPPEGAAPREGAASPVRNRSLSPYCPVCGRVRALAHELHPIAHKVALIWGYVSEDIALPAAAQPLPLHYRPDEQHFLLALSRRELENWLSDLLLHYGYSLTGMLQIVPLFPPGSGYTMGGILARLQAGEAVYPFDRLRVRFYPSSAVLFRIATYERAGTLTFDAQEFIAYLNMAGVFISLLLPDQQDAVLDVLRIKDPQEQGFHWGRLLNSLPSAARDMLLAWNPRTWSKAQIYLLDTLRAYVNFSLSH